MISNQNKLSQTISHKNAPTRATDHSSAGGVAGHKKTVWYRSTKVKIILCVIISYGCIFAVFVTLITSNDSKTSKNDDGMKEKEKESTIKEEIHSDNKVESNRENKSSVICPYQQIADLAPEEYKPKKGIRHMVDPPQDTNISLVCCKTTVGPLSILVHHSWAPNGAKRFLEMVDSHYFDAKVPFMRCVHNFLCQFGLAGGTKLQQAFRPSIQDDPNWLPEGVQHRMNDDHVMRFAKGYMAYAGAGPHSRSNQFIIALKANGPLGGGSPWEVPFAELVGTHSYETLDSIYTGYGEHGPSQGLLWKENSSAEVREKFPELDYVTDCWIADRT